MGVSFKHTNNTPTPVTDLVPNGLLPTTRPTCVVGVGSIHSGRERHDKGPFLRIPYLSFRVCRSRSGGLDAREWFRRHTGSCRDPRRRDGTKWYLPSCDLWPYLQRFTSLLPVPCMHAPFPPEIQPLPHSLPLSLSPLLS